MKTKLSKLALVIGAMVMAGGAMANPAPVSGSDTGRTLASATVSPECAVSNGGAIAFASLEMLSLGNATQTTVDSVKGVTFDAICTNGTAAPTFKYVSDHPVLNSTGFQLSGGQGATVNDLITYSLYPTTDGTGSSITGGVATGHPELTVGTGATVHLNLSARILAADKALKITQDYADGITITAVW